MKKIRDNDFKFIEVNFQYKNEIITIKSEPFNTLENIKMKAIKKMINIPKNDLYCFYLGIDISKNKDKKIGDLFSHCDKVTIKLNSKEKKNNNYYLLNNKNEYKKKSNKNSNNEITNISTIYSSKKLNIKTLIIKDKNSIDSERKNVEILFKNKIKFLTSKDKDKNNSLPLINKSFFSISKDNNNDAKYICRCNKNKIFNYCKNCLMLLCNDCKISEKHNNHIMIQLNDDNYIKDIIDYSNNIQKDIINNINFHKTLLEKINILSLDSLSKYRENAIEKYKKMIDKYIFITNKIEIYLNKKGYEKKKELDIENFNILLNKLNQEIIDLKEKTRNKNIEFNDLEIIFYEISNREQMLLNFKKNILKYYIINEINIKINSSIKLFEKIIDKLTGNNIFFNLDNKYHKELIDLKLIKPLKKIKDEKDETKQIIIGGHEISKDILCKRRNNIFRTS